MIYLDSAAVVKLVHAEAESEALRDWPAERAEDRLDQHLADRDRAVTRAGQVRAPAVVRLPAVLDQIDPPIRPWPRPSGQPPSAAWARHLGTALPVRQALTLFAHLRQAAT